MVTQGINELIWSLGDSVTVNDGTELCVYSQDAILKNTPNYLFPHSLKNSFSIRTLQTLPLPSLMYVLYIGGGRQDTPTISAISMT